MYTIKKEIIYSQNIKKSLFICHLKNITNLEEANLYLDYIKNKYRDATHHCYSYIIGENAQIYRQSDDGEPKKSAGTPIYEVLRGANLSNIICIVIRYFGGIKLGVGGLIRAYSSSTKEALKLAELEEIIIYENLTIIFNYELVNKITNLLANYQLITKEFTEKVKCIYQIPQKEIYTVKQNLISLTNNNIEFL